MKMPGICVSERRHKTAEDVARNTHTAGEGSPLDN
jgi:hypothetical protein